MKKFLFGLLCLISSSALAQEAEIVNTKTTLDKVSGSESKSEQFVVMPIIITEPAVGSFGLGLVPVYIKENKPIVKDGKEYPVSPDMTAVGVAYTANNTWAAGGGKMGYIEKYGLKYKILAGYADANLEFYRPSFRDKDKLVGIDFNIKAAPVHLYLTKQLPDPRFTMGANYTYAHVDVSPRPTGKLIPQEWLKVFNANLSRFDFVAEFDNRDNTFTPNKGIKATFDAGVSAEAIGSISDFQQITESLYWYHPIRPNLINGVRVEASQMFGKAPFYLKPYISMRGVPALKYQGDYTLLGEVEERYDFGHEKRWSLIGFGGLGKAFDDHRGADDAEWVYSYGAGGRYLVSKEMNLRVGLDFAMGKDGFTYYIVFGNNWSM